MPANDPDDPQITVSLSRSELVHLISRYHTIVDHYKKLAGHFPNDVRQDEYLQFAARAGGRAEELSKLLEF